MKVPAWAVGLDIENPLEALLIFLLVFAAAFFSLQEWRWRRMLRRRRVFRR